MRPTFVADARCQLVAAADPRAEARDAFQKEFGCPAYESAGELCSDPNVEIVYIASPHQFHADQVITAARHGKHVLVEKPLALSIADCYAAIKACQAAGVYLITGPSHGFDAPVIEAAKHIAGGRFGGVRMITAINFTDFLYRPRRPEELLTASGGGVVFSQGAHQVDVTRRLAGGSVRTVRAQTGAWDARRPTDGAYTALLTFDCGVVASLTYSGYGHYDTDALMDWIGETGEKKDQKEYGAARRRLANLPEAELKTQRAYGSAPAPTVKTNAHEHFGFIIASCDGADIALRPTGIEIYSNDHREAVNIPTKASPRATVIDEVWDAVVSNKPPLHGGTWGAENLAVCLAIIKSSTENREVELDDIRGVQ